MKRILFALMVLAGPGRSVLSAHGSVDSAPARHYGRNSTQDAKHFDFSFPPVFERERGVSWDGRIDWKTGERAWVFAAALEGSLKGIVRAKSPYRLSVAVVRAEKQTGIFVVEFTIQAPSGESVEVVQVEGVCPRNRSVEEIYPAVAGEIVTTFKKHVLQ